MIEQVLTSGLIKSNPTMFLGEVAEVDFITAANLTTLVGMGSTGTVTNASVNWLKYNYKGKITYIAKKALRHGMTWESLDAKGLTKGTVQFTIQGKQHTLRLPTGYTQPPTSQYEIATGGSFNDLIYPIYGGVGLDAPQVQAYPRLASYTDADLGLIVSKFDAANMPGSLSWVQEPLAGNQYHMVRGYNDTDNAAKYQILAGWYIANNATQTYAGWRPIIEEVT